MLGYVPADPLWPLRPGPFARSKAAVWLQLFLTCALMSCPTSHTDAREDLITYVRAGAGVEHAGRLYWIQDPRDGLCVGEEGMAPCGDANLFGIRRDGKGDNLEFVGTRQLGPKWSTTQGDTCLARKHCHKGSSPVVSSSCSQCGARGWTLDGHGRIAQGSAGNCLARSGREVYTAQCSLLPRNGTGTFRLVEFQQLTERSQVWPAGKVVSTPKGAEAPPGMVKDADSGLIFPADMGGHLGESGKKQVFMGGGAFRFFGLDIYQVSLYIDKAKAAASPELLAYAGLYREELAANESFYASMMSMTDPVKYDRSIYVKLLIPLNAMTVKKSLEAEWNMNPQNKKILLDASFRHAAAAKCCGRGTELLFTWTAEGMLEVRLGDRLVEVFPSEELAQDLFFQYVCDDPISPHAKRGFVAGYPEMLTPPAAEPTDAPALPHAHDEPQESASQHTADRKARDRVSYRWGVATLLFYGLLMLLNLPNSRRRFQERLRRGGGSMRALALEVSKSEWAHYMTRVASNGAMEALVKSTR